MRSDREPVNPNIQATQASSRPHPAELHITTG